MKKIIILLLTLALLVNVSCVSTVNTSVEERNTRTYLFAGVDDAAENTDVLVLASYNSKDKTGTVLHIPRDTFCKYDGEYRKINSILPLEMRKNGGSRSVAMSRLVAYLSELFGVAIDGYFCIDRNTLIKTVDLIGGVDVVLDHELEIYDEHGEHLYTLSPGKNRLDGKRAAAFVRYRRGYATGDLGRIDAQKIFLAGLLKGAKEQIGVDEAARLLFEITPDITTDVGPLETLDALLELRSTKSDKGIRYLTLPGEALMLEGVSYYVLNRKSAAETLLRDFFLTGGGFDPHRYLTDSSRLSVENIYNDDIFDYKYFDS